MIRRAAPRLRGVVAPDEEAIGLELVPAAWARVWAALPPAEQAAATRAARAHLDAEEAES